MCTRGALSWGQGDSRVWDMAPPLLGNLGAKFSEMSFPLPPTQALRFRIFIERETSGYDGYEAVIPSLEDLFLLKSTVHIFINFLVASENQIGSQLGYFSKVLL